MSYGRPQQSKAQNEANAKTLRALVKQPENKTCADCKRNDPRWASWNIGCYLCIRCSGIHRSMGTHISKVKSIDLDIWTPEQMETIQKWGNRRCNLYWEAHLKPGHVPPDHKIESFIRSKYELRRWARDGPVPSDPSTLDPVSAAPAAAEPAAAQATSSRTPAPAAAAPAASGGILDLLDDPAPAPAPVKQAAPPTGAAPAVANKAAAAPAQTSAGSGLFDLDWSSAPTTASARGGGAATTTTAAAAAPSGQPAASAASASGAKGKDDILSLFSAPRPSIPNAGTSAAATGNGAFDGLSSSFGGLSLGGTGSPTARAAPAGNGGLAGLDASNPWGAPAAAAPAAQSNSLFDTQDVWASPSSAGAGAPKANSGFGDIWGSSSSATTAGAGSASSNASSTAAKKDDAFADIWGDFK